MRNGRHPWGVPLLLLALTAVVVQARFALTHQGAGATAAGVAAVLMAAGLVVKAGETLRDRRGTRRAR